MKVPKMYKSSDRYNAGTDVIYNDDSKLQYAPFIYATTESGDNGGDEEGEDTMVTIFDPVTQAIDKSFKELKEAVDAGKIVLLKTGSLDDESHPVITLAYLIQLDIHNGEEYNALFLSASGSTSTVIKFEASNETDLMEFVQPG